MKGVTNVNRRLLSAALAMAVAAPLACVPALSLADPVADMAVQADPAGSSPLSTPEDEGVAEDGTEGLVPGVGDDEGADADDPALDEGSDQEDANKDPDGEPAEGDDSLGGHFEGTGWFDAEGEACDAADAVGWADEGVVATSRFLFDPDTSAWYWVEADGTLARGKDVFVPLDNEVDRERWAVDADYRVANGKWVRLADDGKMVKGEDYLDGKWYLFDEVTGAMQYGFQLLPDGSGSKWVFYDYITGIMAHGERYVGDERGDEPGWMYFDPYTGAVRYGWVYLEDADKWVYYDPISGRMWYGSVMIDGRPYYLDGVTGKRLSSEEMVSRLIAVAASQDGITSRNSKYVDALRWAGGVTDPMGPCMTYVWWCFQEAGFHYQLVDGEFDSGYPHDTEAWYSSRGRIYDDPQPGDIWLVNQPSHGWQYIGPVSATHAGIVASVERDADGHVSYVYVWEHVDGWVHLVRETPDNIVGGWLVGYARPNFNEG